MKNLKFKRYSIGQDFDSSTAEKDTLHLVPVSVNPLVVKAYDVDAFGNVAELSFDGWVENKNLILKEIKTIQDQRIKFKKKIVIGEIGANSMTSFTVKLPEEKKLIELESCVIANIQDFTIPNGLIIQASALISSDEHVVLSITNITAEPITIGTKNVVFNVFN